MVGWCRLHNIILFLTTNNPLFSLDGIVLLMKGFSSLVNIFTQNKTDNKLLSVICLVFPSIWVVGQILSLPLGPILMEQTLGLDSILGP